MGADQSTRRPQRSDIIRRNSNNILYMSDHSENSDSTVESMTDSEFFESVKYDNLRNMKNKKLSVDDINKLLISVDTQRFLRLLFKNISEFNINYKIWIQLYPDIFNYKTVDIKECEHCKSNQSCDCLSCECTICYNKYGKYQCINIIPTKQTYHHHCLLEWWNKKGEPYCPNTNINILDCDESVKISNEWVKLKSIIYDAMIKELYDEELIFYHYICYLGIGGKAFI